MRGHCRANGRHRHDARRSQNLCASEPVLRAALQRQAIPLTGLARKLNRKARES
jgi:hypothetical protein